MLKKVFAKNNYQIAVDEKFPLRTNKTQVTLKYNTQSIDQEERKKSRKFSRIALNVCRYIGIGASHAAPSFCYPPISPNEEFYDSGYYTKSRSFSRSYFDTAATLTIP